jgi:carbonic anhydrase
MEKLIKGIHQFQNKICSTQREQFHRLADGQKPEVLFITCSDSRINPNLITQTEPGELFIIRNAGNIVPPFGAANGGEGATIEFAIVGLGVQHIVVCGHSHCGAMQGLLVPESLNSMPTVRSWLAHAEGTRWIARQKYSDLSSDALLNVTIQENVLVQLENLRTHPAVAAALAGGLLSLHAWVYKIETGDVFSYDSEQGQFLTLADSTPTAIPAPYRLVTAQSI